MPAIITYDHPHLKTEQLVHALLARGETVDALYALPFTPRPARPVLFAHRPDQSEAAHPKRIARAQGLRFVPAASAQALAIDEDEALIAIGCLIPEHVLRATRILNVHAGIIPACRGLDAFKWALLDGKPLGVTLHRIDADIDMGDIHHVSPTPVYPDDTPERLARRHYENELEVLAGYARWRDARVDQSHIAPGEARRRMPRETEQRMLEAFPAYVEAFARAD